MVPPPPLASPLRPPSLSISTKSFMLSSPTTQTSPSKTKEHNNGSFINRKIKYVINIIRSCFSFAGGNSSLSSTNTNTNRKRRNLSPNSKTIKALLFIFIFCVGYLFMYTSLLDDATSTTSSSNSNNANSDGNTIMLENDEEGRGEEDNSNSIKTTTTTTTTTKKRHPPQHGRKGRIGFDNLKIKKNSTIMKQIDLLDMRDIRQGQQYQQQQQQKQKNVLNDDDTDNSDNESTRQNAYNNNNNNQILLIDYNNVQTITASYDNDDKRTITPLLEEEDDDEEETSMLNNRTRMYPERPILQYEESYYNDCELIYDWQRIFYPTCNNVHELELYNYKTNDHYNQSTIQLLSMSGSWRSAWRVPNTIIKTNVSEEEETTTTTTATTTASDATAVVLKMLHLSREYDIESYNLNQVDSIAMERLTKSPYIINEYVFCGTSTITEYAQSDARSIIKDPKLSAVQGLTIALNITKGLQDLHYNMIDTTYTTNNSSSGSSGESTNSSSTNSNIGSNSPPIVTFVHNDINIANMVMVNNNIKLNDFNIGMFVRKNKTAMASTMSNNNNNDGGNDVHDNSNIQTCGFPVLFNNPMWRAPEEIINKTYVNEKIDIYSLGSLLYQILTKHQPFTWLQIDDGKNRPTIDDIISNKTHGIKPNLPYRYIYNKTRQDKGQLIGRSLSYGVDICFNSNPSDRPTSKHLANAFELILQAKQQKKYFIGNDNDKLLRELFYTF